MNSSRASATKRPTTLVAAPRASSWIERFALPLTISVMEAQPIALVISLLTRVSGGPSATPPLGVGTILLVILGLLWWAMAIEHLGHHSTRRRRLAWLHAVGWFIAFVALAGPSLPSLVRGENIPAVLVDTVLVTWYWRRDMQRAQSGFEYDQLARSFKISFGVLLGILSLVIVLPDLQELRQMLASALPIFFLSGLVMLSLARLGAIRNARRSLDSSQTDPTRSWLLALTCFSVVLIVIVTIIESVFSFATFEVALGALAPLWNALGILVDWILYVLIFALSPIFYLLSFLFSLLTGHPTTKPEHPNSGPKPPHLNQPWNAQAISPEIFTIGRWAFLALATTVVLLAVIAGIRRWYTRSSAEGVEEVREGLDARSFLGERWRTWWNRWRNRAGDMPPLEPLDPTSARARYREMLQTLATERSDLTRRLAETPAEYEARLLIYLGQGSSLNPTPNTKSVARHANEAEGATDDAVILDELTRAYADERYGGKRTDLRQRVHLQNWAPHLLAKLTGKTMR